MTYLRNLGERGRRILTPQVMTAEKLPVILGISKGLSYDLTNVRCMYTYVCLYIFVNVYLYV